MLRPMTILVGVQVCIVSLRHVGIMEASLLSAVLLEISSFPVRWTPHCICRLMMNWCGTEFRLRVANFLRTWSNFGWLCQTFADRTKEIFLQPVRIVHIPPSWHGGLQLPSGETNDRSQRTKYQQPFLPSQALDQQRLERLAFPPPTLLFLLRTWTIYASAAYKAQD